MDTYGNDFEGFKKSDRKEKKSDNGMVKGLIIGAAVVALLFYLTRNNSSPQPESVIVHDTVYIEKTEVIECIEGPEYEEAIEVFASDPRAEEPGPAADTPNSQASDSQKPHFAQIDLKYGLLFAGIPNPISVSVLGIDSKDIKVTIDKGSVKKAGDGIYNVLVEEPGMANIAVSSKDGEPLTTRPFHVMRVPNPVPCVGKDPQTKHGGEIAKSSLVAQSGVVVEMENLPFDMKFYVVSFKVSSTVKGYPEEHQANSAMFTPAQMNLIRILPSGSIVSIHDIKAKGPDGTIRDLQSIVYKIK